MMTQLMSVSESLPKKWLESILIGHYCGVAEDLASFTMALDTQKMISACFQKSVEGVVSPSCTDISVTFRSKLNISLHVEFQGFQTTQWIFL